MTWFKTSFRACVAGVAAAAGLLDPELADAAGVCAAPAYGYAGVQASRPAHGIRATVVALAGPEVADGHVAAWVGVGGPGLAPGGEDAWIQVGLSALPDGATRLYFEVNRPGTGPRYTELQRGVRVGVRYRVAVLEVSARPEWWRVWVNGVVVSPPVHLPGSSGRWLPIATAETWDAGGSPCNRFAYRFEHIAVLSSLGGPWARLRTAHRFADAGYRVRPTADGAVLAQSADAAA
jgi:hypothetical protein